MNEKKLFCILRKIIDCEKTLITNSYLTEMGIHFIVSRIEKSKSETLEYEKHVRNDSNHGSD
jgi:hypothetical protein